MIYGMGIPMKLPIKNKINKSRTTIIFRVISNFSHMEWREKLAEEKTVRDLKLHFGRHKLESTDTHIIGFMANKIPTVTHMVFMRKQFRKNTKGYISNCT
jgi:hypothetical protein